jgi:ABC-2 type transport system ATP-binding protein
VIDHGRIIADGTGDELKDRAGGVAVAVVLLDASQRRDAIQLLARAGLEVADSDAASAHLEVATTVDAGLATVQRVAGLLDDGGIDVRDLGLRRPSLDDVFLDLTGSAAATDGAAA